MVPFFPEKFNISKETRLIEFVRRKGIRTLRFHSISFLSHIFSRPGIPFSEIYKSAGFSFFVVSNLCRLYFFFGNFLVNVPIAASFCFASHAKRSCLDTEKRIKVFSFQHLLLPRHLSLERLPKSAWHCIIREAGPAAKECVLLCSLGIRDEMLQTFTQTVIPSRHLCLDKPIRHSWS